MKTIIFEKRNLILITIALVVVMGVFFCLTYGNLSGEEGEAFSSGKDEAEEIKCEINYGVEDSHYPSEVREESYKNIIQSEKYYNELKQLFFLSDSARYSNNFAGMFYDEYGILNVCLTQIDTNLVTQYKEVNFIQKEFSYNELNKVYDAFDESLFKMYDIQRVCIDEIDNEVEIYLLKDTHVENIYFALQEKINFKKKILKFIIDENSSFHFTANTVYGGESVFH